ncbi:MAG TPA: hypothetical protein VFU02_03540 [Polyangiaceae bacterium]|nr:hypothetical protein [Polyangiaceae bacterium]
MFESPHDRSSFLAASGQHAVVAGYLAPIEVIEAGDPLHPEVARHLQPAAEVVDVQIVGSIAVVSMGQNGAAAIALDD